MVKEMLRKIFFPFIFISWRLITLHYCSGFLPYIDMNQPEGSGGEGAQKDF